MIPVSFKYDHATLRKLLPFVSQDETRYVITGVCVECDPDEGVRLVASDGRRLIAHETDWNHGITAGMEPQRFVIRREMIECSGVGSHFDEQTLSVDAAGLVRMELGPIVVMGSAIEGNYPTWRSVFPKKMPTVFPARRFVANAMFMREMLEAVEALHEPTSGEAAQFVAEDEGPIMCKYDHGMIVLMPMRDK